MLNQHSLEEIADIHNLLGDIKKEYNQGIKPILIKNSSGFFQNPHTVPKLKKIPMRYLLLGSIELLIDMSSKCTVFVSSREVIRRRRK